MTKCPSRFELVKLRVGDVGDTAAAKLKNHLEGCDKCRVEFESIDQTAIEYESRGQERFARLRKLAAQEAPTSLDERRALHTAVSRRVLGLGSVAAAALLAIAVVFTFGKVGEDQRASTPLVRVKGGMSMTVVVQRGDRQFRARDGDELFEGDAVRFMVDVGVPGFLSVFATDPRGEISSFYPDGALPAPLPVEAKGRYELPDSVVLDDAVGTEYFICVFSQNAFDRNEVNAQIGRLVRESTGDLQQMEGIPQGLSLEVLRIVKAKRDER